MKRLTGTNKEIAELLYQEQLELSKENRDVESTVQAIIEDVKKRGDEALRDYSAKFDKVDLTDFEVGQDLIDQAFKEIDPEVYQALVNAKENIESYHKHQLETGFEDQPSEGVIRGQLIRPINRVGVYVPGGTAAYPSSVLMNVIPAKIAGVKEIIMITPPQEHFVPAILVVAKLAGGLVWIAFTKLVGLKGLRLWLLVQKQFQKWTRLQVLVIFSWRLPRNKFTVLSVLI